jgi:hypothetical protein
MQQYSSLQFHSLQQNSVLPARVTEKKKTTVQSNLKERLGGLPVTREQSLHEVQLLIEPRLKHTVR